MSGEMYVTMIGNLVTDPELRFTAAGVPVVNFRMAQTGRFLDKTTNEWKDGSTVFLSITAWRQYAENVAESLSKGDRAMVYGRLDQREYETNGEKRTAYEINAEDVGVVLRNATAKVSRITREGAGQASGGDQWQRPSATQTASTAPTYTDGQEVNGHRFNAAANRWDPIPATPPAPPAQSAPPQAAPPGTSVEDPPF